MGGPAKAGEKDCSARRKLCYLIILENNTGLDEKMFFLY